MDCIVQGITESQICLSNFHFTSKACPEILKIPNSSSNMAHYLFLYAKKLGTAFYTFKDLVKKYKKNT